MKVLANHRLDTAKQLVYHNQSPMNIRRFLVIHHTAGASALSSYEFWKTPQAKEAEAHILIDRDGTVYQVMPFNQRADHAGKSAWVDPGTGKRYEYLNSCSIGIELANAGPDEPGLDAHDWAKKQPGYKTILSRHKNGGPVLPWECYPAAQLAALYEVCKVLVVRYNLDDLMGHDDIAPNRKVDPGPALDMTALRKHCGFTAELPKLKNPIR